MFNYSKKQISQKQHEKCQFLMKSATNDLENAFICQKLSQSHLYFVDFNYNSKLLFCLTMLLNIYNLNIMIVGKQLKKSCAEAVRYSLDQRTDKQKKVGKKLVKEKRIKKNLSQIPIEPIIQAKENMSLNSFLMNRPHSSLIAYQINQPKMDRKKKKRLSLDSVKYEKQSVMSRYSKKQRRKSKNSFSLQDQQSSFKNKLGQMRKRCNLSCNDMTDAKDTKKQKKQIKKSKRYSAHEIIVEPIKVKKQKVAGNNMGIKNKSKKANLAKKGSTVTLMKQSKEKYQPSLKKTSNAVCKKKHSKVKKNKKDKFIVSKDASFDQQYPIRKYIVNPLQNERFIQAINCKDRSKLNQHSKKAKQHPLIQIDYTSCMNIFSASSGVFKSSQQSLRSEKQKSRQGTFKNFKKKLDGQSQRYSSSSLNLSQIRYFQKNSPIKQQHSHNIISRLNSTKIAIRQHIMQQIGQQYPGLDKQQSFFLSSVILIQRKWRQKYFYNKIFKRNKSLSLEKDKQVFLNMKETRINSKTFGEMKDNSESLVKQTSKEYSKSKSPNFKKKQVKCCEIGVQAFENIEEQINQHQITQRQIKPRQKSESQQQIRRVTDIQQDAFYTDRTSYRRLYSKTQYYSYQKEAFPSLSYLAVKSQQYRQSLHSGLYELQYLLSSKQINQNQYQEKRTLLQKRYITFMGAIKKSKHDIKKGYLKYIQCLQKAKLANKSGLRRVSSQSGFMSILYQKFYQFDKQISNSSDSSQSLRRLSQRYTIRKDYIYFPKIKECVSEIKQKQDHDFSAKMEQYHTESVPSEGNENLEQFITKKKEHKDEISLSKQILSIKDEELVNISQFLLKSRREIPIRQVPNQIIEQYSPEIISQHPIFTQHTTTQQTRKKEFIEYINSPTEKHENNKKQLLQSKIQQITDWIIEQLTLQLHDDLSQFNTIRVQEVSPRIIKEQQYKRKRSKAISLPSLNQGQQLDLPFPSPLTTRREKQQCPDFDVPNYLIAFFKAIKENKWDKDIVAAMNEQYGFSSLAYLKFLRDFQIPEDDYQPLISNQQFIVWESQFLNNHQEQLSEIFKENIDLVKQTMTIYHRCIFQMLMSQLQKRRKYGEKGKPFPWQHSSIHFPEIKIQNLYKILNACLVKIETTCNYKCGIIDNKYLFFSEEDIEKVHEENEDRIITMLQNQLNETNNKWYELEEHMLQVRLQINMMVQDQLFMELLEQITIIQNDKNKTFF